MLSQLWVQPIGTNLPEKGGSLNLEKLEAAQELSLPSTNNPEELKAAVILEVQYYKSRSGHSPNNVCFRHCTMTQL